MRSCLEPHSIMSAIDAMGALRLSIWTDPSAVRGSIVVQERRLFCGDFMYPSAPWDDPLSPPGGLYAMCEGSSMSVYHTAMLKVGSLNLLAMCMGMHEMLSRDADYANLNSSGPSKFACVGCALLLPNWIES